MESIHHQTATNQLPISYNSNYSQSTLPHLLVEYGLKDHHKAAQLPTKWKQKKDAEKECSRAKRKKNKTFGSFINVQDEKVSKRQTEREEYFLKLVQDMHKLRDYYYKEYMQRLSQKIKRQQEEIKEKDIQSKEKKREQKEEEERKARHKLKKRFEHHTLETSSAATNIPKTDLYYIVGLEEKLLREGKLKAMTDYNTFRLMIQDPQVFYTNFKVQKSSGGKTNPSSSLHQTSSQGHNNSAGFVLPWTAAKLSDSYHPSQKLQSSSQITELRKSSRPDCWAITQQYPTLSKKRTSIHSFQKSKSRQDIHLDLDKMFPKVEMPKLHCFNMNLTSKPPDLDQVQQTAELRAKEKHRKRLMRQVAKMYQLAMSNVATSARILDQHKDMDMLFNGPALCDVIADNHWIQAFKIGDSEVTSKLDDQKIFEELLETITEKAEPDGTELIKEQQVLAEAQTVVLQDKSDVSLSPITSRENSSLSSSSESGEDFHRSSAKSKISSSAEDKKLPLPLTMEEIKDKYSSVEAKSLSTFWMNYMGVGK